MRTLARNKQTCYYSLYQGLSDYVVDGKKTGEKTISRSTPTEFRANISSAKGEAQQEWFGTELNYDKVIVTDNVATPIDENTVLWVDKAPYVSGVLQPFDYKVVKVSKSLNSVSIAIEKVKVS